MRASGRVVLLKAAPAWRRSPLRIFVLAASFFGREGCVQYFFILSPRGDFLWQDWRLVVLWQQAFSARAVGVSFRASCLLEGRVVADGLIRGAATAPKFARGGLYSGGKS